MDFFCCAHSSENEILKDHKQYLVTLDESHLTPQTAGPDKLSPNLQKPCGKTELWASTESHVHTWPKLIFSSMLVCVRKNSISMLFLPTHVFCILTDWFVKILLL